MLKAKWALAVLIVALTSLSIVHAQGALTWNTYLVDEHGSGGSLAIDSNGNPHIAYEKWYTINTDFGDASEYGINYAVWTGTNWATQTVDPLGGGALLVLDSHNAPHILYQTSSALKYAVLNDKNWTIQTIDSAAKHYSMALDSNNNPHLIYEKNKSLNYAWLNGSTWTIQTVDSINSTVTFQSSPSIALDKTDCPHIIYLDSVEFNPPIKAIFESIYETCNVKYATVVGSNWVIQTVATNSTAIGNLALNQDGQPSFCFMHKNFDYFENGSIGVTDSADYAYLNGNVWLSRIVDSNPALPRQTYLQLDSNGYPQIYFSAVDDPNGQPATVSLTCVSWAGQGWVSKDLGSFQASQAYYQSTTSVVTLSFDSNGNPSLTIDGELGTLRSGAIYGALTYASVENLPTFSIGYLLIITSAAIIAIFATGIFLRRKRLKAGRTQ